MIDLKKITLCAISSVKIPQTIKAIQICQDKCIFNNVIFFSDEDVPHGVKIPRINSIDEYNNFVIHRLPELVLPLMSDYLLTVHWDGFIVNPESWTDKFYEYDYIGAPWPWFRNLCGNGGFCLKSKKFLQVQFDVISNKISSRGENEDLILCYHFRKRFIRHGCKYAEPEIAYLFSTEFPSRKSQWRFEKPFGFHDFKYNRQYEHLVS